MKEFPDTGLLGKPRGKRPWAHHRSTDDPRQLEADPRCMELLQQAFGHLDQDHSYRTVASWLSDESGEPISAATLYRYYMAHCAKRIPRFAKPLPPSDKH